MNESLRIVLPVHFKIYFGIAFVAEGIDVVKQYQTINSMTMRLLGRLGFFVLIINLLTSCSGQSDTSKPSQIISKSTITPKVGGGCEGCELMFVGMPEFIFAEHTSLGWTEEKQKLILTGKVYQQDGKTAAPNVIVYYWHTDAKGLYSSNKETPSEVRVHGKLRGWVKSDEYGNYKIKTSRPASYPNQEIPQHIHLSIKEPDIVNEYFADLYFDDDPLYLKYKKTNGAANRAGTELLRVVLDKDVQIAEHNIVLGLNIPDYPVNKEVGMVSGLEIGEDQPSFIPFHAFGPDKGTRTCPVCKYGRYHGVVYFVGEHSNWTDIKEWLKYLDEACLSREQYLKAYFVYGNSKSYNMHARQIALDKIGHELKLQKIALTFVPSFSDTESEVYLNNINAKAENTIVLYRHRTIVDKFVNLKPNKDNFNKIIEAINRTMSEYFELPEPKHE